MAGPLAEITMAAHVAFLAYVVFGAFLAWRWPRALLVHLPFALWGLAIATLGFRCPLTDLEDHFRGRTGEGFLDRYLDGVLYPQEYLALSRLLAAAVVVTGYAGALLLWHRRRVRARAAGAPDRRPDLVR